MIFDLNDHASAQESNDRPMFGRDGIQLFLPYRLIFAAVSLAFHALLVVLVIVLPALFPPGGPDQAALERRMAEARARQADDRRFVFVQPRAEFEAKRPPVQPQLSDRDRSAQAPEQAPDPQNTLPFSRGNTPEQVDQPGVRAQAEPEPPAPQPSPGDAAAERGSAPGPTAPNPATSDLPRATGPDLRAANRDASSGLGARLGDAVRNIQRYYGAEQVFDNPQGGGGQFGSAIQFDTKGVEFGPWIRRFIAQIKRNWFVPYAAMSLKGHVVVTFNVHKDGRITDVTVVGPSGVEAFNNSSFNAIASSSPTQPLPPEYPADKAFFTVTFFYNETPPR